VKERTACMVLVGTSEVNRLLGINVRSGDRNIEMDPREMEWKVDRFNLARDRKNRQNLFEG